MADGSGYLLFVWSPSGYSLREMDGDPPHTPRGCIAQAWSVAEVLRLWRTFDQDTGPA